MLSDTGRGTWEIMAPSDSSFTLVSKNAKAEGKRSTEFQVLDQDRLFNKALQEIAYRAD